MHFPTLSWPLPNYDIKGFRLREIGCDIHSGRNGGIASREIRSKLTLR